MKYDLQFDMFGGSYTLVQLSEIAEFKNMHLVANAMRIHFDENRSVVDIKIDEANMANLVTISSVITELLNYTNPAIEIRKLRKEVNVDYKDIESSDCFITAHILLSTTKPMIDVASFTNNLLVHVYVKGCYQHLRTQSIARVDEFINELVAISGMSIFDPEFPWGYV